MSFNTIWFQYDMCTLGFNKNCSLTMHTNRKHIKYLILILPSKNETKKLAYINGKTMYHCGKCQDKFTHENSLIEHKRHSKLIVPELLVPELLVPELLVKEISTLKATNMITCDNHRLIKWFHRNRHHSCTSPKWCDTHQFKSWKT